MGSFGRNRSGKSLDVDQWILLAERRIITIRRVGKSCSGVWAYHKLGVKELLDLPAAYLTSISEVAEVSKKLY